MVRASAVLLLLVLACAPRPSITTVDGTTRDGGAADAGVVVVNSATGTLDPLVLGVWGAADDDVWMVGGEPGDWGRLIAHFDGTTVRRVVAPPGPTLWWVFGTDATHVWACGEGGSILFFDGLGWTEQPTGLDDDVVLWGIWASGEDDLWAVGGSHAVDGPKGVLMRSTGGSPWQRITDPSLPTDANLFKVFGRGPGDVLLVGDLGVTLHWDGQQLVRRDLASRAMLFTVHGHSSSVMLAVGGRAEGRVVRWTLQGWVDDGPPEVPGLNGVFVRPDGDAWISGAQGVVLTRAGDGGYRTVVEPGDPRFLRDTFHAVWSGEDTWLVGGVMETGQGGVIATTSTPPPSLQVGPPPPPPEDAGIPDAFVPDARMDMDAGPAAGPGEPCPPPTPCREGLSCLAFAVYGYAAYCTRECFSNADCAPEFGDASVCEPPGPQLIEPYCGPTGVDASF